MDLSGDRWMEIDVMVGLIGHSDHIKTGQNVVRTLPVETAGQLRLAVQFFLS